jgi:hypothetical protein
MMEPTMTDLNPDPKTVAIVKRRLEAIRRMGRAAAQEPKRIEARADYLRRLIAFNRGCSRVAEKP